MTCLDKMMVMIAVVLTAIVGYMAVRYMVASEKCKSINNSEWCKERYWNE